MITAHSAWRPLSRARSDGRPTAPVRHVHLGLGSFFRAHQAWYTDHAPDAAQWGIAAFAGRSAALADALAAQDNLYTLITRSAVGDSVEVVSSVSASHPAHDHGALLHHLGSPEVRVVTLTITEAGYHRRAGGGLDTHGVLVQADIAALRADPFAAARTMPGRLLAALAARRSADAGRLTIIPCDNLPDNGAAAKQVLDDLAALVDPTLATWIENSISYVTTVVDRITPRTTEQDIAAVGEARTILDRAPVVTEPFSEWVLSGECPGGRPSWEQCGAVFTADITAYEQRKLWLLNGGHSLLAYAGSIRGHRTVADAVTDDLCREWLAQWWHEASRQLSLPPADVTAYRLALTERFANPRIQHLLDQIAADGSQKLPVRVLPVIRAERADGRLPLGALRILAAWICHLRGSGAAISDPKAAVLAALAAGSRERTVRQILRFLDPDLGEDSDVSSAILAAMDEL